MNPRPTLFPILGLAAALCAAIPAISLFAADAAWKLKEIPEWTEADAKQILADSPWAKSVTPTVDKAAENKSTHHGHLGLPSIGINGIGRRKHPDNDDSSASSSGSAPKPAADQPPPKLTLRWETALPIREAELKARETTAPTPDQSHYALAIYGIPSSYVKNDSKELAQTLRGQALIKRDSKTDLKPSSVDILLREDGPVLVYFFPRTGEITWRDHHIEFDGQVGPLKIKQMFDADDMRFHGNLEI